MTNLETVGFTRRLLQAFKYDSIFAYMAMDIQVESQGDYRILHIKGKITFEYCPMLQSRLEAILDEGARRIELDFTEVPFIDSSGVGEVLRLFKRMSESGGEVILANPNKKLRELFLMYRFDRFMKIREQSNASE
jgi:anti-sigma B factor antagonist